MNRYEISKKLNLPTQNIPLNWPERKVDSLCPVCLKHLSARIYEKGNKIFMEKKCSKHGNFKECLSKDAVFFKRNELLTFGDGWGQANPQVKNLKGCPESCGLCSNHIGTPCLCNIDLTNRCNMKCPVCFANSNAAGYVFEPSLKQIEKMIKIIRKFKPVPATALQYSGGEPTMSPLWFDALRSAKKLGIRHLQAASNGIKFARTPGFAKQSKEAGLDVVYLQFDGTNNLAYKYTRNISNLWKLKLKAVEEIGKAGIGICLVSTIVKGESSKNIGDIIRFAIKNKYVSSISLQPVSFTGRMDRKDRERRRFTLTDVAEYTERQTKGIIKKYDWYPVSVVSPLSRFLDVVFPSETRHMIATTHPHCGLATFLCVNKETEEAIPIPRFFDIEGSMSYLEELSHKIAGKSNLERKFFTIKALVGLKKFFKKTDAPKGMKFSDFLGFLKRFVYSDDSAYQKSKWRMVLVASMHFQDGYNFESDRIRRCPILFCAPDGKIYPFCSYNVGPYYRGIIEKKYSLPIKEWVKTGTKDGVIEGFYEKKVK